MFGLHLIQGLQRRGHEVLVITETGTNPRGTSTAFGIDLVRLDFDVVMGARNLARMRRIHDDVRAVHAAFRPDVIHMNDTGFGSLFFLRGGATERTPRVLTIHSPIRERSLPGLQSRLAEDVDGLVLVSHPQFRDFLRHLPEATGKARVIPNALPTPRLRPTDLPFSPPRLLCVGRLADEKGFDVAIKAFARLRERGSPATMVVAGDGDRREALERLAGRLGLADAVTFTGFLAPERIDVLLNSATAMIVPSRWAEPFGLVALQAAQMGRPAIASAVGGLNDIVADGETGWLVPPDDVDALVERISQLLANPQEAKRMGGNARRRAVATFDFDAFVKAYETAFHEALAHARQRSTG